MFLFLLKEANFPPSFPSFFSFLLFLLRLRFSYLVGEGFCFIAGCDENVQLRICMGYAVLIIFYFLFIFHIIVLVMIIIAMIAIMIFFLCLSFIGFVSIERGGFFFLSSFLCGLSLGNLIQPPISFPSLPSIVPQQHSYLEHIRKDFFDKFVHGGKKLKRGEYRRFMNTELVSFPLSFPSLFLFSSFSLSLFLFLSFSLSLFLFLFLFLFLSFSLSFSSLFSTFFL